MRNADIVDDIFSRMRQILEDKLCGEIADQLDEEEKRVRRSWGGTEHYVATRSNRDVLETKKKAMDEINRGVSVKDVVKHTGISRTEMYRLLSNKKIPNSGGTGTDPGLGSDD